jgi:hypothetical protein
MAAYIVVACVVTLAGLRLGRAVQDEEAVQDSPVPLPAPVEASR